MIKNRLFGMILGLVLIHIGFYFSLKSNSTFVGLPFYMVSFMVAIWTDTHAISKENNERLAKYWEKKK